MILDDIAQRRGAIDRFAQTIFRPQLVHGGIVKGDSIGRLAARVGGFAEQDVAAVFEIAVECGEQLLTPGQPGIIAEQLFKVIGVDLLQSAE